MLPFEKENREEILSRFETDFGLAENLIQSLLVTTEAIFSRSDSSYSEYATWTLANIAVREIRRFRSIVLECEIGHDENAQILLRSMFEGLLAVRFIVSDPIPLAECSPDLQGVRKKLPAIPDTYNAVDFRAGLHVAGEAFSNYRVGSKSDTITPKQLAGIRKRAADAESEIGPDRTRTLTTGSRRYCGLQIRQQAESYGLEKMYEVYQLQCVQVHANDATRYIERGDGWLRLNLARDPSRVPDNIQLGVGWIAAIIKDIAIKSGIAETPEFDAAIAAWQLHLDATSTPNT